MSNGGKKNVIDKQIRINLMNFIAENNITQIDFGKVCGKSNRTISSWLNGKSAPSAYDIKLICEHYKISSDFILGLESK